MRQAPSLRSLLAHLPGQHDQQDHAPGGTGAWYQLPESQRMDALERELSDPGRWVGDRWVQSHAALVQNATRIWQSDPEVIREHVQAELAGAPRPTWDEGKVLREQARALVQEIEDRSHPAPTLYRGGERVPSGITGWSESRSVAQHWADLKGGEVHILENGQGIRLDNYIGDYRAAGAPEGEREWIVLLPETITAHLPGQHDQADHNPHEGASGKWSQGPFVTLYHGRNAKFPSGQQNLRGVVEGVAKHLNIDAEKLYWSDFLEFSRVREEEKDTKVYLSGDPEIARRYANIGGESLDDTLTAAYYEVFPEKLEMIGPDHDRLPWKEMVRAELRVEPEVLEVRVPYRVLQEGGFAPDLSWDEFRELVGERPKSVATFTINEPFPDEAVRGLVAHLPGQHDQQDHNPHAIGGLADPGTVQKATVALQGLLQDYPHVGVATTRTLPFGGRTDSKGVRGVKFVSDHPAFAAPNYSNGMIEISTEHAREPGQLEAWIRHGMDSGEHAQSDPGREIEFLVAHEFAHALYDTMTPEQQEVLRKGIDELGLTEARAAVNAALSRYATSSFQEMIAEGFAESRTSSEPRRLAQFIGAKFALALTASVVAHLPGQHDQQDHAPNQGGRREEDEHRANSFPKARRMLEDRGIELVAGVGQDPEIVDRAAKSLSRLMDMYPGTLVGELKLNGSPQDTGGSYAQWISPRYLGDSADGKGVIEFAGVQLNYESAMEDSFRRQAETGFHVPTDAPALETIMAHEFGHAIWTSLEIADPDFEEMLRDKGIMPNFQTEFARAGYTASALSSYANTNEKEFFAEAFAEYHTSKEPRAIARAVGEWVQELVGGKPVPPSALVAHLPGQHDQADHNPHKGKADAKEREEDKVYDKLEKLYERGVKINFPSVPREIANRVVLQVDKILEQHPQIAGTTLKSITTIGETLESHVPAAYDPKLGTVYVNPQYLTEEGLENLEKAVTDSRMGGGHVPFDGSGLEQIITHEIGHAVATDLGMSHASIIGPLKLDAKIGEFLESAGAPKTGYDGAWVERNISSYANFSSSEMFAELFSESVGTAQPRPVAAAFKEWLDKEITAEQAERYGQAASLVSHLPGEHDQADHAPTGGSNKTPEQRSVDIQAKLDALGPEGLRRALVERFGVTDDMAQAGYVLPDGRGLDLQRANRDSEVPGDHGMAILSALGFPDEHAADPRQTAIDGALKAGLMRWDLLTPDRDTGDLYYLGVESFGQPTDAQIRTLTSAAREYGTEVRLEIKGYREGVDWPVTVWSGHAATPSLLGGLIREMRGHSLTAHLPGQHEQADHAPTGGIPPLDSEELVAYASWVGATFPNWELRGGRSVDSLPQVDRQAVAGMDSAIAKQSPSSQDEVFYRGIKTLDGAGPPGGEFRDLGFTALTRSREFAEDRADTGRVLEVLVPAGTRYLDIDAYVEGGRTREREVVLPRGSTFKVDDKGNWKLQSQSLTAHLPGQHEQEDHNPHEARGLPPSSFKHPETGEPLTRTAIGEAFEFLLAEYGREILEQRYGGKYERLTEARRQNPLDIKVGDRGFEVKTLNESAKNQRAAMKPDEVDSKMAYAEENGLKPGLIVQVVDPEVGKVKMYVHEDGISSKSVSRMELIGEYGYEQGALVEALTSALARTIQPGDTVIELGPDGVPIIYVTQEPLVAHLPGQHDQADHNPHGAGAEDWRKLANSPGDRGPGGRVYLGHLQEALHSWKGDPSNLGVHLSDVLSGNKDEPANRGHANGRMQAEALLEAVAEAPVVDRQLYRGMVIDDPSPGLVERFAVGREYEPLRLQGYSSSRKEAWEFADDRQVGQAAIRITVEPGAQALRIGDHITSAFDEVEREYVAGGKFVVTARSVDGPYIDVRLRQVEGSGKPLTAHLPGQHDQQDHNPHKGKEDAKASKDHERVRAQLRIASRATIRLGNRAVVTDWEGFPTERAAEYEAAVKATLDPLMTAYPGIHLDYIGGETIFWPNPADPNDPLIFATHLEERARETPGEIAAASLGRGEHHPDVPGSILFRSAVSVEELNDDAFNAVLLGPPGAILPVAGPNGLYDVTLAHEFGHLVHWQLRQEHPEEFSELQGQIRNYIDANPGQAERELSLYAMTSEKELFSEAFAMWTFTEDGVIPPPPPSKDSVYMMQREPSELARMVGETVDRLFRKQPAEAAAASLVSHLPGQHEQADHNPHEVKAYDQKVERRLRSLTEPVESIWDGNRRGVLGIGAVIYRDGSIGALKEGKHHGDLVRELGVHTWEEISDQTGTVRILADFLGRGEVGAFMTQMPTESQAKAIAESSLGEVRLEYGTSNEHGHRVYASRELEMPSTNEVLGALRRMDRDIKAGVPLVAHLPGQHDQSDHNPYKAVAREYTPLQQAEIEAMNILEGHKVWVQASSPGTDPRLVVKVAEALKKNLDRYPQLGYLGLKFGETEDRVFATYQGGTIVFNDKFTIEEFQAAYEKTVERGWHPPTNASAIETVTTHEFAHAVSNFAAYSQFYSSRDVTGEWLQSISSELNSGEFDTSDYERRRFVREGLSQYANSNTAEFFAEAFTEFYTSDNPRPLSRLAVEKFDQLYKVEVASRGDGVLTAHLPGQHDQEDHAPNGKKDPEATSPERKAQREALIRANQELGVFGVKVLAKPGLPAEKVTEAATALGEYLTLYPSAQEGELPILELRLEELPDKTYGSWTIREDGGAIWIDVSKAEAEHKDAISRGWHPPSDASPIETLVAHEFGHALMDSLTSEQRNGFVDRLQLRAEQQDIPVWKGSYLAENLSKYGATNAFEAFAEAFAEYHTSSQPRDTSKLIVGVFEDVLNYRMDWEEARAFMERREQAKTASVQVSPVYVGTAMWAGQLYHVFEPTTGPVVAHLPGQHDQADHNPHEGVKTGRDIARDRALKAVESANSLLAPHGVKVNLQEDSMVVVEAKYIEDAARTLKEQLDRFPDVLVKALTFAPDQILFGSWNASSREIVLAGNDLGVRVEGMRTPFDAQYERTVADGFHPPTDRSAIETVVAHEFGHAMQSHLELDNDDHREIFREAGIQSSELGRSVTMGWPVPLEATQIMISKELSEYANTNPLEFISESWAEYQTSDNPRPIATAVGKWLEDKYEYRQLERMVPITAHLPGQHDQSDHNPHEGGGVRLSSWRGLAPDVVEGIIRSSPPQETFDRIAQGGLGEVSDLFPLPPTRGYVSGFIGPDGSVVHDGNVRLAQDQGHNELMRSAGIKDVSGFAVTEAGIVRVIGGGSGNNKYLGVEVGGPVTERQLETLSYALAQYGEGGFHRLDGPVAPLNSEEDLRRAVSRHNQVIRGLTAHLPGEHDQADHNPHEGKGVDVKEPTSSRTSTLAPSVQSHMSKRMQDIETGEVWKQRMMSVGWSEERSQEEADVWAARYRAGLEELSARHGMSSEEYLAATKTHLQDLVDKTELWIRTPITDAPKVLADERFKSQYESKHSSPGGVFDPSGRREREAEMFGDREEYGSRNASRAPIYGYLNERGVPDDGDNDLYGLVRFRLNDEAMDRSTVSPGDSLSYSEPTPARDVDPRTLLRENGSEYQRELTDPLQITSANGWESQTLGGVRITDVAEVRLPTREMVDNWYLPGNARDAMLRPNEPGRRTAPSAEEAWSMVLDLELQLQERGIPVSYEYVEPNYKRKAA